VNPTSIVLTTIATVLQLINAAEPDIAAIINLFRNNAETLEQYLTDADATENSEIIDLNKKIKS